MRGYDTAEYASSRLIDTIIRHKGMPVVVKAVGLLNGEIGVQYSPIIDDNGDLVNAPLSECDINPVPLGYVNFKRHAHYIMRSPMRRDWRQGLRMLNIVDSEGMNPRMVSYGAIAQTIMGNYPTFTSCLEKLNDKKPVDMIAFHRDFAVHKEFLQYKGTFVIGKVDMTNGNVLIDEDYSWTREAFEEAMEIAA